MSDKETAIVVGAGTGLGAALVRCFAGAGMTVAAALRNPDKLDPVIEALSGQARAHACDATDEDSVSRPFRSVAADPGEPGVGVFNAAPDGAGGRLGRSSAEPQRGWGGGAPARCPRVAGAGGA